MQKVTIVPHGQALGVTEQVPGEERHNFNRAYLKARLAVMLGGRTAEEIAVGEITTGVRTTWSRRLASLAGWSHGGGWENLAR